MTSPDNVIAWLVPTARGTPADKASHMPSNIFHAITTTSSPYLTARVPSLIFSAPQKALQLSFDHPPKRPGSFVLGTDPRSCDIVLPPLKGISPQHCALRFDGQNRLVLDDFSETGTQVWYGWESSGDRIDHSWVLTGEQHQRVSIDIQGVRFQVIPGDNTTDPATYAARVETFCEQPNWAGGLSVGWDRVSVAPIAPLFSAAPLFRHVCVKGLGGEHIEDVYLWNMAKPWEPMIKAAAA